MQKEITTETWLGNSVLWNRMYSTVLDKKRIQIKEGNSTPKRSSNG
jgi:hypothetical protein